MIKISEEELVDLKEFDQSNKVLSEKLAFYKDQKVRHHAAVGVNAARNFFEKKDKTFNAEE
jgi:hypothetical protein